jgi:hypothetical protein
MSAPKTHDPLVVNTKGGVVWTLRAVSEDGKGWYAPEAVCSCPRFLLTPLSELAALGITGSADVLPVPVGPEPQPLSAERLAEAGERGAHLYEFGGDATADEWNRLAGDDVPALVTEIRRLTAQRDRRRARLVALQNDVLNMRGVLSPNGEERKVPMPLGDALTPAVEWLVNRVAELEAERHSTNEALSEAAEALRADRDRIAELERPAIERHRREVRESYRWLASHAGEDCDFEGEAVVRQQLAEREAVWAREDELAREFAADPLAVAPWVPGPSVEASADRLTRFFAPTQALREDEAAEAPGPQVLTEAEMAAMWDAVDEATPGHIFKYEYQRIVRAALGAIGIPLAGDDEDDKGDTAEAGA